jgi:hypothetical protein
VSLSERCSFAGECHGEAGRHHLLLSGRLRHSLPIEGDSLHDAREDLNGRTQRVGRVEDRLFVFLEVFLIARGEALHEGEEAQEIGIHPGGLTSDELEGVGILLLGHEARPGRKGLRERDVTKRGCGEPDEVLREPRKMRLRLCAREDKLRGEVPIRHSVERVLRGLEEAELGCKDPTIERQGASSEGARA